MLAILHHGLLAPGHIELRGRALGCFMGVERIFAAAGLEAVTTQVHPTAGIERRARRLKELVLASLEGCPEDEKVLLVGHSMGGLDARYMISHLDMARRVAALVTIATPHRGSPFADWCLHHLGRLRALKVLELLGLDAGALPDLTTAGCARFNERTPDMPDVCYYSITAARPFWQITPLLYHSHQIVAAAEGENDGLVSVGSATWGLHLETWPADHLHVLNWRFLIEVGEKTGDITPYYQRLVQRLRDDGIIPASEALS